MPSASSCAPHATTQSRTSHIEITQIKHMIPVHNNQAKGRATWPTTRPPTASAVPSFLNPHSTARDCRPKLYRPCPDPPSSSGENSARKDPEATSMLIPSNWRLSVLSMPCTKPTAAQRAAVFAHALHALCNTRAPLPPLLAPPPSGPGLAAAAA
eukprot:1530260-Rhodomonas_salina.1